MVGSGAAGILCAWGALLTPYAALFQVGFVASFCSKLSDTMSSEIGKGFGKTTYSITQLKSVPPGTEGAVSLEGTAAGVGTALSYAVIAVVAQQVGWSSAVICAAAATVANLAESYIGALAQGKVEWLTNDVVNVIQITLAAVLAMGAQAAIA